VAFLLLIIGIVLGTGVNVWYSHHNVQVSWMLAFTKVPIKKCGKLATLRFLHIIDIVSADGNMQKKKRASRISTLFEPRNCRLLVAT
jgi:hypothetical protein